MYRPKFTRRLYTSFVVTSVVPAIYSLEVALKEVIIRDFLDSSNKRYAADIVILNFHRFINLGHGDYDYISSAVEGYCILAKYKDEKKRQQIFTRIVIAWNGPDFEPLSAILWPGVNQRWYEDADSLEKLYEGIKSDMEKPPAGMWATCSFMNPVHFLILYTEALNPFSVISRA